MVDSALDEVYATRNAYNLSSQQPNGTHSGLSKPTDVETVESTHSETNQPTHFETSKPAHFETSKPAYGETRENIVDAALEEVYATRNTYKRQHS